MVHYPPFYKNNHYTDFTSLRLVHTTPEKFENTTLFLRLGLPSTLIRHENGAFRNPLFKPEEFENAGFTF